MNIKNLTSVIDVDGNAYNVKEIIGQGGQGVVYRLQQSDLAVKLLTNGEEIVEDNDNYFRYEQFINEVISLQIADDVNLCRPIKMLKAPMCGYIMHLLNDLQPVSKLLLNTTSNEDDVNSLFLRTFGLKKRYELLTELSRILARLHSNGIIYSDLSPNNVFYSNIEKYSKVWLIDCDNLRRTTAIRKPIFTPTYEAPEISCGVSSNTTFSDCYSFAVLAFRLLTNNHPTDSQFVKSDDDDDDGWSVSTSDTPNEVKAKNWVYTDIDPELETFFNHFIAKDVLKLFKRTFSTEGMLNPTSRPSMREWYEVLKETNLKVSKCESCSQFIFAAEDKCPFCNAPHIKSNVITINQVLPNYKEDSKKCIEDNEFAIDEETKEKLINKNVIRLKAIHLFDGLSIYDNELNLESIEQFPKEMLKFTKASTGFYVTNMSNEIFGISDNHVTYKLMPGDRYHIVTPNIKIGYLNKFGVNFVLGVFLNAK